jgi:chemosensory pili system protein ChpA (sensor histidine kinase/response regulator)
MPQDTREGLLAGFAAEVAGYVPEISDGLRVLLDHPDDRRRLRQVYRLFHTIKGAAAQLSLPQLSGTARLAEDLLARLLTEGRPATGGVVAFCDGVSAGIADFCAGDLRDGQAGDEMLGRTIRAYYRVDDVDPDQGGPDFQKDFEILCSGGTIIASPPNLLIEELLDQAAEVVQSIGAALSDNPGDDTSPTELVQHLKRLILAAETKAGEQGEELPTVFTEPFAAFLDWLAADMYLIADQAVDLLTNYLRFFYLLLQNPGQVESAKTSKVVESMEQVRDFALMMIPVTNRDDVADLFDEQDLLVVDDEDEDQEDESPLFRHAFARGSDAALLTDEAEPVSDGATSGGFDDEDDMDLHDIFVAESEEHLQAIGASLVALERLVDGPTTVGGEVAEQLAEMRRAIHTLKGAAGMTGYQGLFEFAHRCEDLLDSFFDKARQVQPHDVTVLGDAIELIEVMAMRPQQTSDAAVAQLSETIGGLLAEQAEKSESATGQFFPAEDDSLLAENAESEPESETENRGVLDWPDSEKQEADADRWGESVRQDQPLDVESGFIRVRLDNLDELVGLESELIVTRSALEQRLTDVSQAIYELNFAGEKLKTISYDLESGFEVESLHGFGRGWRTAAAGGEAGTASEPFTEFDPIELDRYTKLHLIIRSLNELAVDVGSIHHGLAGLANEMRGHVANQQLLMRLMQDKLVRVRMTPLSAISRNFFRTVRSASANLGKRVKLVIEGEDVFLDRFVWNKVSDPIMHILRNAVDHGIEPEEVRRQAGKQAQGVVRMKAVQRGSHVLLEIADDGGGIDTEAIRRKLLAREVVEPVEQLSETRLLEHLFVPGFSTRDQVSHLSGRGVGLDVVRQNLLELRGSVRVQTRAGQGTTFFLRIPVSLSINRAAIVLIGTEHYAAPLQDILEIRRISRSAVLEGDQPQIRLGDETVELKDLAAAFGLSDDRLQIGGGEGDLTVLLADSEHGRVALVIDRIVEQQEIIVKDLGTHLRHVEGIGGVTIMGDGSLIPILNVNELASPVGRAIKEMERSSDKVAAGPFTVMVVDDSVSVRQSVLRLVKNNGWLPILATDGVDAAEKLDASRPDAIVLDIEMPRMNGFEFLGILRSQARYQAVPVIMLTSRFSEKHQKKAEELGADHYLIKPYKEDQFVALLQRIASEKT